MKKKIAISVISKTSEIIASMIVIMIMIIIINVILFPVVTGVRSPFQYSHYCSFHEMETLIERFLLKLRKQVKKKKNTAS